MKLIASMLIDSDTVKRAHAIRAHARVHRLTLSDLVNNLNKSTAPGDKDELAARLHRLAEAVKDGDGMPLSTNHGQTIKL